MKTLIILLLFITNICIAQTYYTNNISTYSSPKLENAISSVDAIAVFNFSPTTITITLDGLLFIYNVVNIETYNDVIIYTTINKKNIMSYFFISKTVIGANINEDSKIMLFKIYLK